MGCLASKQATSPVPAAAKAAQKQDGSATRDSLAFEPASEKWLMDNGTSLEKLTQQAVKEQGDQQGSGKQEQGAPAAAGSSIPAHDAPARAGQLPEVAAAPAAPPPAAGAGIAVQLPAAGAAAAVHQQSGAGAAGQQLAAGASSAGQQPAAHGGFANVQPTAGAQAAPVAPNISSSAHGPPTQAAGAHLPAAGAGHAGQPHAAAAEAAGQPPAASAEAAGKPPEALPVATTLEEQRAHFRVDKELLTKLWRKGLACAVPALGLLENLPTPGGEAVKLLKTVLEHCNNALENKDNIMRLVERCTNLMGLLVGQPELADTGEGSETYKKQMDRFRDALKGVRDYCSKYTRKAWVFRAFNAAADQEEYEGLVKDLDTLVEDTVLGVVLDTHLLDFKIKGELEYQVIPELQKVEKDIEKLTASINRGHHELIPQLEMRAFWHSHSCGQERMSWKLWWKYFPVSMKEWLHEGDYNELCALLKDDEARENFEQVVDEHDKKYISVDEVACHFNVDNPLVPRVRQLLNRAANSLGTAASGTVAPLTPTTAAGAAAAAAAEGSSGLVSVLSDRPFTAKCDLPDLEPIYYGREAAAQHVLSLLTSEASPVRAVLLLGGGGLGKSSLAVDVGWRLWRAGLLPGGAALVKLSDAATETQQLQRFCTALGILYDDDALPRLLARLGSLPPAQHLLLVMENAEDCLVGASAAPFTQLVAKVMRSSPAVRLLITSRVTWPTASPFLGPSSKPSSAGAIEALPDFCEVHVAPVDQAALAQLLRKLCREDVLPPAKLQPVLAACGGSPLLTRLVADALKNGRLVAQDVIASAGSQPADGGAVRLVLASLRKQQLLQLAQLAVFPYTFDEEDAAAILDCLSNQAQTLLHVLRAHSLLLYDAVNQQHYLHTAVKQQAMVLAGKQLLQDAREAFIRLMLARLGDWAALYQTKSFARALRLLRQQAANVDELWQLVSECDLQQGTMQQVAAAMSNDLRLLLLAGHKFTAAKPAWHRLEQWTFSEAALHANALTYAAYADGLHTKQAEAKLRTALDVRQRVLGQGHLDTITSTCNLASCLEAMGQYAAAEPMLRTALEVRQRALGQGHPDTISSLNDLAACLKAMGQHSAAEPMFRTALKERQRVLGPDHPDTTRSISNLASCLEAMGQYAAAERMFRNVLEAQERVLGPEHPGTISSSNRLAGCLLAMGQYDTAETMYRAALEVCQRVLGPEHPGTISCINNLATCLHAKGQYAAAESTYRNAVELQQRVLGPEHPRSRRSSSNLATCLHAMSQHAAAEPLQNGNVAARAAAGAAASR